MPTPSDMKGKSALVTGAAAGLGRATALRLARAGAEVRVYDISAEALQRAEVATGIAAGVLDQVEIDAAVGMGDLAYWPPGPAVPPAGGRGA